MMKRAARAAVVVVLLASAGCGPAQPIASPPSSLSEAPPNEVSGLEIPPGRIDDAIAKVDGLVSDLMKNTGIPGLAVAKNQTFNLNHWDGDTFTFTLTNENAPAGTISKATFDANTLNLEYYDSDKLGTFTR
jgi:predicted small lipoprotein YifL